MSAQPPDFLDVCDTVARQAEALTTLLNEEARRRSRAEIDAAYARGVAESARARAERAAFYLGASLGGAVAAGLSMLWGLLR